MIFLFLLARLLVAGRSCSSLLPAEELLLLLVLVLVLLVVVPCVKGFSLSPSLLNVAFILSVHGTAQVCACVCIVCTYMCLCVCFHVCVNLCEIVGRNLRCTDVHMVGLRKIYELFLSYAEFHKAEGTTAIRKIQ